MRIALAHKRLDLAGGTERDFYRTAEGLRDLGHEVHLFCAEFSVPPPAGTHGHKIPFLPLGRTARLVSFAVLGPKIILSHGCDVVVSFGRMVEQDVLRSGGGSHRVFLQKMAQGEGTFRRLWHRLSLYHRGVLAIERLQFRPSSFKKILAVSQEVREEIVRTYRVPEDKITVLYNGVDQERFHPRNREAARARIRDQWGIPLESALVLFVGSGFKRKGLDRLLRVWDSPRFKGVYLLVVGEDQNQNYYRLLARKTNGRVVFAGRQEKIEDYYGAADLLALPAFQEAFGNVVLEALASGLPVVVANTVGAAEVLAGELRRGILENPDDPLELEEKILTFLRRDGSSSVSQEARRLGENYSWKNHFRKVDDYLLEVSQLRRHGNLS